MDVETVRDFVIDQPSAVTTRQVAEGLGIHVSTAIRKLKACVQRGWLLEDDHDAEGFRVTWDNHRWCENA